MTTPTSPAEPHGRFALVARDSVLFALGPAIGKAIAIVTLPVLTRTLGPSSFGQLDIISTLVSASISILLLGIDAAAIRLHADHDASARREHHATWMAIATACVLPFGLLVLAFRADISDLLFGTTKLSAAVGWAAVAIVAGTYHYIATTLLQLQRRPIAYAWTIGGTLVVNGMLAILFVLRTRTITSVMFAMALSLIIGACAGAVLARGELGGRPTRRAAKSLFSLGLPLAPAATLLWVGEFANRFVLLRTSGAREVGFFSVGLRFASIAALAVAGFQLAWLPHAFQIAARGNGLRRIGAEAVHVVACVATVVVAIAVVTPELVQLVSGAAFDPAVPAVGASLVAVLGSAVFLIATMPSSVARRMKKVGIATASTSIAAIVGVLVLAPRFGATGAALAVAAGQVVGIAIAFAIGRGDADLGLAWLRMGMLAIAAAFVTFGATSDTWLSSIPARAVLVAMFLAVLAVEGSLRVGVRLLLHARPGSSTDGSGQRPKRP